MSGNTMNGNKVSWLNVIKFAGAFIAFLIGSGFATGQEILQYFTAFGYGGIFVGLFTVICLIYVGASFMLAGFSERFRNVNDIYRYYCGKYIGGFYDYFSVAFIFMSYIVMIAGTGAAFEQHFHISPIAGGILMAILSVGTVIFGLDRIVVIIGSIGPAIVLISIGVGLGGIFSHPGGVEQGAALIQENKIEVIKVGSNWFWSGVSYVGFIMLWLAAFLAAMGKEANSRKEAVIGTTIGAIGFTGGAVILMFGLLANLEAVHESNIPSLILAKSLWPPIASVFSVIILAGIYTTSVPLLWSVSARFAENKSKKFILITVCCAVVACFVGLSLSFPKVVNIIYGVNGYFGILLIFFMIAKSAGLTKKLTGK